MSPDPRASRRRRDPQYIAPRIILFFLLVIPAWGFLYIWDEEAVESRSGGTGFVFQGDKQIETVDFTLSFENYVLTDKELNITFSYSNSSLPLYVEDLLALNFTIDRTSTQSFYGSEPLGPPTIRNNVSSFTGLILSVRRLSRLEVEIAFHYSTNGYGPAITPRWKTTERLTPIGERVFLVRDLERALHQSPYRSFSSIVPIMTFFGWGALFARVEREHLVEISKAYYSLKKKNGLLLREALVALAYRPNLLGYGFSAIFAPALTLLKIMVQREVTSLDQKTKMESEVLDDGDNDESKDIVALRDFLGNDATKPAATLFELRTISLVVGFLTSVGLTFGWNAGAIGPLLLAVGVAYLSVNLGFLAVVIGKSRGDILVLLSLVLATFLVISFSDIITTLRYFPAR